MSAKTETDRIAETEAIPTQVGTCEDAVGNWARDGEIRRRAFEIYLERGDEPGCELDDWLQAERELESGVIWLTQAD